MRRRHGTKASSPWYRAAVILGPLRWQESICQCRRYAADTPTKAKGGAADKYCRPPLRIRGRPSRASTTPLHLDGMLDEMQPGVFRAWCRGRSNWCWVFFMLCIGESGCGQRSLDVASKAGKVNVLQEQGVAMQPVVHHASAPPLESIPAVVPINRLRVVRRRQTTPRHQGNCADNE
jgi:hypothetical protein